MPPGAYRKYACLDVALSILLTVASMATGWHLSNQQTEAGGARGVRVSVLPWGI